MNMQKKSEARGDSESGNAGNASIATPGTAEPRPGRVIGRAVDPEIVQTARRRFSAAYKVKILKEIEACKDEGKIGEVLRREGLYSSHLSTWRRQRDSGGLAGLAPGKRGRRSDDAASHRERATALEKELSALKQRLRQAEVIIEVQKKISSLLGVIPSSDQVAGRR